MWDEECNGDGAKGASSGCSNGRIAWMGKPCLVWTFVERLYSRELAAFLVLSILINTISQL